MATTLSMADVARLMREPAGEALAATIAKVAEAYSASRLSQAETAIAEDIFRILAKDGDFPVREALVGHLKDAAHLPHDIARLLATDVDFVAAPMLRCSQVLRDLDLIECLATRGIDMQLAIAERPRLSAPVVEALMDGGEESVLARLLANQSLSLDQAAIERVIKLHGASEATMNALSGRAGLSGEIAESLIRGLTERLESEALRRNDVSLDEICDLLFRVREVATINLLNELSSDDELERLTEHLQVTGHLSPSLALRALCLGDVKLFEAALARLAGIPIQSARTLIHDKGTLGLESIYLRAALPENLYPAIRAGIEVIKQTGYRDITESHRGYMIRVLERNLTQIDVPAERISVDDLAYLLTRLDRLAA